MESKILPFRILLDPLSHIADVQHLTQLRCSTLTLLGLTQAEAPLTVQGHNTELTPKYTQSRVERCSRHLHFTSDQMGFNSLSLQMKSG